MNDVTPTGWVTVGRAGELLGIDSATVYTIIDRGRLETATSAGRLVVSLESCLRYARDRLVWREGQAAAGRELDEHGRLVATGYRDRRRAARRLWLEQHFGELAAFDDS